MFPALDLSLDSQSATTLSLLLLLPVLARAWAPLGEAQTDASSHLNKGCCRTGVRLAAREPANLPTSTATADPSHESYIEELRQFNSDRFQAAQNDPQAHSYTYEPNSSPEGTEEGWYDLAGTGLDFNVGSETPRGLAAPKSFVQGYIKGGSNSYLLRIASPKKKLLQLVTLKKGQAPTYNRFPSNVMLPVPEGQINPDNPLAIDYLCKPSLLGDFAQDRFQVDTARNQSNGLRAFEFRFFTDMAEGFKSLDKLNEIKGFLNSPGNGIGTDVQLYSLRRVAMSDNDPSPQKLAETPLELLRPLLEYLDKTNSSFANNIGELARLLDKNFPMHSTSNSNTLGHQFEAFASNRSAAVYSAVSKAVETASIHASTSAPSAVSTVPTISATSGPILVVEPTPDLDNIPGVPPSIASWFHSPEALWRSAYYDLRQPGAIKEIVQKPKQDITQWLGRAWINGASLDDVFKFIRTLAENGFNPEDQRFVERMLKVVVQDENFRLERWMKVHKPNLKKKNGS